MRIHITKRQKKSFIMLSIFLAIYIGFSIQIGFPLGFGRMMARGIAKDYCEVVYPQATVEKTVYNPVSGSFGTVLYLGDEKFYISTNPNEYAVDDRYREKIFLEETGAAETISRLHRTCGSGQQNRFLACHVYWNYDDPMTPIANLRFYYEDYETPILPNDAQIKEILIPIVLECIIQVEEHLTLDNVCLHYYHPDFDPDEEGKTWRILDIPLTDETPRTKELLDGGQFRIN